jgi:hypothetical protein
MSRENVEVVRRAIRHLNQTGEPDWNLYDTNLVWTTRPDGPAHFTYRGLDGLRRGSRSMRQVWAELHGEILEVVDSGEVVVSVIRWHLRGRSGVELDEVEGWVTLHPRWQDHPHRAIRKQGRSPRSRRFAE